MSSPTSVNTRFLVISDTHNFESEEASGRSPFEQPLPRVDVLLHCGDLTHCGGSSSYRKALKLLGTFDAKLKIIIAGNHDLDLDGGYWTTHLGEGDEEADHEGAEEVMTDPWQRKQVSHIWPKECVRSR